MDLECFLEDEGNCSVDRFIAGCVLFAIFGRCRFGDLRYVERYIIDYSPIIQAQVGYIEAWSGSHKMRSAGSKIGLPLPLVAPIKGFPKNVWGRTFINVSKKVGLNLESRGPGPVLPAPCADETWSDRYLSNKEIAKCFKTVLEDAGASDLSSLSPHGCKATMLAMLARYGASEEDRAILGHHVGKTKSSSVAIYSRDLQAGPLRRMEAMMHNVRKGSYVPDNMPIERLRVGCGLQCTLPHVPLVPSNRTLLFSAAVKLLKFAMGCESCSTHNEAEEALWYAMHPLLCNPDEHVLSTIGALALALLEGRTDLPISGVFGAGKTRSAAILVVGLLVFEPNLNLMILTKENVAAQAFAEHIEALELPPSITSKIGRLVGYMELKKNKTNKTTLDVACENRHDVPRQKKLLIGCGGGFQQECSQSYSPVARWITEVALTLTDESQQYGNFEETSVIARTPRTCINIWAGDHRQTPGGLKNTVECRLFRQKPLQRPLALRCGTEYVQPHEMCRVVERYLDGPCDSPSHQLKQLLANDDPTDSEHITAVTQLWCEIFDNEETWLTTSVCVSHALPSSGLPLKVKVCPLWLPPLWMQRLALLSDKNGG